MSENEKMTLNRECPICQLLLKFQDFKTQHKSNLTKLWNNNKIAIPCCRWFEILQNFFDSNILNL